MVQKDEGCVVFRPGLTSINFIVTEIISSENLVNEKVILSFSPDTRTDWSLRSVFYLNMSLIVHIFFF